MYVVTYFRILLEIFKFLFKFINSDNPLSQSFEGLQYTIRPLLHSFKSLFSNNNKDCNKSLHSWAYSLNKFSSDQTCN